jgi:hypothetical protein
MKLLATDIQATGGLAVAGDNAYFGTSDSLELIPLSGGSPKVMVTGAKPVGLGIGGSSLIWEDASDAAKTEVLSVPLDALDFTAHSAAGATVATVPTRPPPVDSSRCFCPGATPANAATTGTAARTSCSEAQRITPSVPMQTL